MAKETKSKGRGKRTHDWDKIELEYITSDMSVANIADTLGISRRTVAKNCRDGDWVAKRKAYRSMLKSKIQTKVLNRQSTKQAKIAAEGLSLELDSIDTILKEIDKALKDSDQFYKYLTTVKQEGFEATVEKVFTKIDTKAINDLLSAFSKAVKIKQLIYQIMEPYQSEKLALERERLAIDRERLELDKKYKIPEETDEAETGVVMLPPVDISLDKPLAETKELDELDDIKGADDE